MGFLSVAQVQSRDDGAQSSEEEEAMHEGADRRHLDEIVGVQQTAHAVSHCADEEGEAGGSEGGNELVQLELHGHTDTSQSTDQKRDDTIGGGRIELMIANVPGQKTCCCLHGEDDAGQTTKAERESQSDLDVFDLFHLQSFGKELYDFSQFSAGEVVFLQQAKFTAELHDERVFAIAVVGSHLANDAKVQTVIETLCIDIALAHIERDAFAFGAEMPEHLCADALTATSFRYRDVGDVVASDVLFIEHVADDLTFQRGDDTAVVRCQAKEGKVVRLPWSLEAFLLDSEKAGPVGGPIHRAQFENRFQFDLDL